jgi:CSLREA domain-containing protein
VAAPHVAVIIVEGKMRNKASKLLSVLAAAAVSLSLASQARAIEITVTSLDDADALDGQCTLREAIRAANSDQPTNECQGGVGNDNIRFAVSGRIVLSSSLPSIDGVRGTISIDASGIILDSGNISRAIDMKPGSTLDLSGITIRNGNAGDSAGGGIRNNGGTLRLSNAVITGSTALRDGGGMALINSTTVLNNVLVESSTAGEGGGIFIDGGNVQLNGVSVINNRMTRRGGGIYVTGAPTIAFSNVHATRNQVVNPEVNSSGGGIFISTTNALNIENIVVVENAARNGGGIHVAAGTVSLTNVTIARNAAELRGGGIWSDGPTMTVKNSTVSDNRAKNGAAFLINDVDSTGGDGATLTIEDTTLGFNNASASGHSFYAFTGTSISLSKTVLVGAEVQRRNCIFFGGASSTDNGQNLENSALCGLTQSSSITNTNGTLNALSGMGQFAGSSYSPGEQLFNFPVVGATRGICGVPTPEGSYTCDRGRVQGVYKRVAFIPIAAKN